MGFINLGRLNIRKRNSCASALVSLSDVQPSSVYKSHILNGPIKKLYLSSVSDADREIPTLGSTDNVGNEVSSGQRIMPETRFSAISVDPKVGISRFRHYPLVSGIIR